MATSNEQVAESGGSNPDILDDVELRKLINAKNTGTFTGLERQLRSSLGVIPFIGAGMSAAIDLHGEPRRFPAWGDLLRVLANGSAVEAKVRELLEAGDYEGAASMVDENRPGILSDRIRDAFDREVADSEVLRGAISYVPFLAAGPVITTNYDRVLERAFRLAGREFKEVISGPFPDLTVAAIHTNERALFKIHGDCQDGTFRVFTVKEYERAYGSMLNKDGAEKRVDIASFAWLLFANRPLLFLGCSLENDRTVKVLRALHEQLPSLKHYAVMAADKTRSRWHQRERHLDELGVRALWYPPGKHYEIERLLNQALERSSTRALSPLAVAAQSRATTAAPTRMAEVAAKLREGSPVDEGKHRADLNLITRAIYDDGLAFFLGAYAALDPELLGDTFYQQLGQKFECPALAGDRTAVAEFISSRYGANRLWDEVRSVFTRRVFEPSLLHRLIAALPAFLHEKGRDRPLWILTTNYDTLMEQALAEVGEAFHLLYYVNDGENDGGFIHRSPAGIQRRIERPGHLRGLAPPAHVIVKLNGGLVYFRDMKERVLIERADFERLAARIPAVLPAFLRTELQRRSLLFLGHGLTVPDVGQLIRFAGGTERTLRSWAVQLEPAPKWRRTSDENSTYWRGWGLQILHEDLTRFTAALSQRILQENP
jgi:hypothetical protein